MLLGVLLAGVATACFNTSTHVSHVTPPPSASMAATTKLVVRLSSNSRPRDFARYRVEFGCGGDSQGAVWSSAVCAALSRHPARYSDTYIPSGCMGGIPGTTLRIDGTLGRQAHSFAPRRHVRPQGHLLLVSPPAPHPRRGTQVAKLDSHIWLGFGHGHTVLLSASGRRGKSRHPARLVVRLDHFALDLDIMGCPRRTTTRSCG